MIEVLIISNQGMKIVEKYGCLLEKVGLYVFRPFFVKLAKSSNKVENQKKYTTNKNHANHVRITTYAPKVSILGVVALCGN